MNYWDSKMQEADVRRRLSRMSSPTLSVFAIGCTTHARDVVVAQTTEDSYTQSTALLNGFWTQYPSSLSDLQSYVDRAGELAPGEDAKLAPAEGPLIWSMLYSFKCGSSKDSVSEAIAAIGDAYHAVFAFRFERGIFSRDENQIWEIEEGSTECLAEIRFQLDYLSVLEGIKGVPPSYSTVLSQIPGGD